MHKRKFKVIAVWLPSVLSLVASAQVMANQLVAWGINNNSELAFQGNQFASIKTP